MIKGRDGSMRVVDGKGQVVDRDGKGKPSENLIERLCRAAEVR